jgi:hypothetical protein
MIYAALPDRLASIPRHEATMLRERIPLAYHFVTPAALAAEHDVIDLVGFSDPKTPFPWSLNQTKKPTLVIVGDDPGLLLGLGGPNAWRCTERLRRWCRAVIIHAAGGEQEHYAIAVQGTVFAGRLALIETTSHHAAAWAERLACPHTLTIIPRQGQHPLPGGEVVH